MRRRGWPLDPDSRRLMGRAAPLALALAVLVAGLAGGVTWLRGDGAAAAAGDTAAADSGAAAASDAVAVAPADRCHGDERDPYDRYTRPDPDSPTGCVYIGPPMLWDLPLAWWDELEPPTSAVPLVPPAAPKVWPCAGAYPGDCRESPTPPAAAWSHEDLADFSDANVEHEDYRPLRLEDVGQPRSLEGPRLAIGGLNHRSTYDYGVVGDERPVAARLTLRNVGDADLLVGRVYGGGSGTAARIDGVAVAADGRLASPLWLEPGASAVLEVELDPRALTDDERGPLTRYVQVFSNDPSVKRFEADDPLSHETRLRLVAEVRAVERAR